MSNMEGRPEFGKYKSLVSGNIISVFAVILLVAGVVIIIGGLTNSNNPEGTLRIYYGIGCIFVSALLFIISSIAEDIHYQRYLNDYYVDESVYYHTESLKKLESIEFLLNNHYHSSPGQYDSDDAIPELRYMPSQVGTQQESKKQDETSTDKRVRYVDSTVKQRPTELAEDVQFEYKAQYRKPEMKEHD